MTPPAVQYYVDQFGRTVDQYGRPIQMQQPQAPAPQAPQQPAQPQQIQDLNARIPVGDQRFPKELWGRTIGEALRWYNVLRDRQAQQGQPQQPQAPQAPQQPQAPQSPAGYTPPQQPQAPQQPQGFDIEERVNTALQRALQPTYQVTAQQTMNQVASEFGDWHQYHGQILEAIGGVPLEAMTNPETWRSAYFLVKGRALSSGQAPAHFQQPPMPQQHYDNGNGYNGGAIRTPPPPPPGTEGFFVEGPSAPPTNSGQPNPMNDPRVQLGARKFNLPVEEYVRWMNGNVPPQRGPAPMLPPQGGQGGY